jgi:hypothetical protein
MKTSAGMAVRLLPFVMRAALLFFLSFCFTGALWATEDRIEPGEIWRDNRGKHIQAHGGSIL